MAKRIKKASQKAQRKLNTLAFHISQKAMNEVFNSLKELYPDEQHGFLWANIQRADGAMRKGKINNEPVAIQELAGCIRILGLCQ